MYVFQFLVSPAYERRPGMGRGEERKGGPYEENYAMNKEYITCLPVNLEGQASQRDSSQMIRLHRV